MTAASARPRSWARAALWSGSMASRSASSPSRVAACVAVWRSGLSRRAMRRATLVLAVGSSMRPDRAWTGLPGRQATRRGPEMADGANQQPTPRAPPWSRRSPRGALTPRGDRGGVFGTGRCREPSGLGTRSRRAGRSPGPPRKAPSSPGIRPGRWRRRQRSGPCRRPCRVRSGCSTSRVCGLRASASPRSGGPRLGRGRSGRCCRAPRSGSRTSRSEA